MITFEFVMVLHRNKIMILLDKIKKKKTKKNAILRVENQYVKRFSLRKTKICSQNAFEHRSKNDEKCVNNKVMVMETDDESVLYVPECNRMKYTVRNLLKSRAKGLKCVLHTEFIINIFMRHGIGRSMHQS